MGAREPIRPGQGLWQPEGALFGRELVLWLGGLWEILKNYMRTLLNTGCKIKIQTYCRKAQKPRIRPAHEESYPLGYLAPISFKLLLAAVCGAWPSFPGLTVPSQRDVGLPQGVGGIKLEDFWEQRRIFQWSQSDGFSAFWKRVMVKSTTASAKQAPRWTVWGCPFVLSDIPPEHAAIESPFTFQVHPKAQVLEIVQQSGWNVLKRCRCASKVPFARMRFHEEVPKTVVFSDLLFQSTFEISCQHVAS